MEENQTLHEKSLDHLQKQIEILFGLRKYELLLEKAQAALHIDPDDPYTLYYLAMTYKRLEKYTEAHDIAQTLLRIDPEEPSYCALYGDILMSLDRYKEAIVQYEKAVELNPHNPMYYQSLADASSCILDKGHQDRLFPLMRKAIELNPNSENHHGFLGILMMNKGYFTEAQKEFLTALQIAPNISILHSTYADLLFAMGHLEEARKHTEQSLQINPMDPTAHRNLSMIEKAEANSRNYEDMLIERYNEVFRRHPFLSKEIYTRAAKLYGKRREWNHARTVLKLLVDSHPDYVDEEVQLLMEQAGGVEPRKWYKNSVLWLLGVGIIAILLFVITR